MIQPIIAGPVRQLEKVQKLVDYCARLDGTDVRIIPISAESDERYMREHPGADFAALQAHGLNVCAKVMKGKPFVWLEPDSIPLKRGWLKTLNTEYERCKKPYMISSDSAPPHDFCGGIGVYGPDTHWLIPSYFASHGWDKWMIEQIPELVHRTPLIQHSYGYYDKYGRAYPHRFPGGPTIRKNSVIFHRDVYQDLMNPNRKPTTFVHTGDLGDIIAALPIIRQLGGGEIVLSNGHDVRPMDGRVGLIDGLLKAQSYVSDVRFAASCPDATYNFAHFRPHYRRNRSLTWAQADFLKVPSVDMRPWLHVTPNEKFKGAIVLTRSPRYHNPQFPWRRIVEKYNRHCIFLGSLDEHEAFCRHVCVNVPHVPTPNLLAVARIIAASALTISNQSSPGWIAMGLGIENFIQETHSTQRDSIIRRSGYQFCHTSHVDLPDFV